LTVPRALPRTGVFLAAVRRGVTAGLRFVAVAGLRFADVAGLRFVDVDVAGLLLVAAGLAGGAFSAVFSIVKLLL
jgi:hypothetical protein